MGCTWLSGLCSLQSRTPSSDLGGPALAQRPHGELVGAAHYVLAPVHQTDAVHAHLGRHEAHAVSVVAHGDQLGGLTGSRGGGDRGDDVLGVDRCKETFVSLPDRVCRPAAAHNVSGTSTMPN